MKIDKANPVHWLCLVLFGANVLGAMLLRSLRRRHEGKRLVVLYGHKLNGNLLAIHRYWRAHVRDEFDMVFLTMDKAYHRQLLADGIASVLATRPAAMRLLVRTDAVISDHGLHAMALMVGRSGTKFFDVWHGIPFKGFDADDFRLQHRYDEVWVASPLMKKLYVERYGFEEGKVVVTGYARTDRLVRQDEDVATIKRELGLDGPDVGKIVLFAPTWKQDAAHRSIWPFGETGEVFLSAMSQMAEHTGSTVVIRSHLNSGAIAHAEYPRIHWLPFETYPDTESILLASDVLVCDWSSIAFDWLLLGRPTIFLDIPAPFAKGFSLGPECRWGACVSSPGSLQATLIKELLGNATPACAHIAARQAAVYGRCADGKASTRCVVQLRRALGMTESLE